MEKVKLLLLLLIILLAFALRFYGVTEIPPSLNWDEASIGYNAYSILKTGHDEWGKAFPIHFRAFGEFKLPAQIYFSIPGIAVFGLNELGVRITPVIYGTLTVLLIFFLARLIFQNAIIGLISAALLAISPWHIQLTRASFESSFALFWLVISIWLFVKGLAKHQWLIYSAIPFAISLYTYNSARVFTPLFLVALLFLFRRNLIKIKRYAFSVVAFFIVLLLPLAPYYLSGEGNSRYRLVSITDDPGLIPRINENRGHSSLPAPFPRLIHNKVTYISLYVIEHYLAHFTPDFLFISGAPHKQHHVQGIGELYWFQAPFLLLGLYFLFKKRQPFRWLIISWLFLSFIPVSVTNDSIPHALRTSIAVPAYQLITAFGFYGVYLILKNKDLSWQILFSTIVLVVMVFNFYRYLYLYYQVYPIQYSRDWQYGYKQAVEFIKNHYQEYDEIVFSRTYGEPHVFTLFFLNYDPAKYQTDSNLVRYQAFDWVWVLRFDKFYFPNLSDKGTKFDDIIAQNPHKKLLFIGEEGDFPKSWLKLKTTSFLNGSTAFEIIEKK